jgi:hypothetical protein
MTRPLVMLPTCLNECLDTGCCAPLCTMDNEAFRADGAVMMSNAVACVAHHAPVCTDANTFLQHFDCIVGQSSISLFYSHVMH